MGVCVCGGGCAFLRVQSIVSKCSGDNLKKSGLLLECSDKRYYKICMQCLSPAGEYNLRLGIIKELQPDLVATYAGRYDRPFFSDVRFRIVYV